MYPCSNVLIPPVYTIVVGGFETNSRNYLSSGRYSSSVTTLDLLLDTRERKLVFCLLVCFFLVFIIFRFTINFLSISYFVSFDLVVLIKLSRQTDLR